MASYLYFANVSPRDRFEQLTLQLDNGSLAVIEKGHSYELSSAEAQRVTRFIVLVPTSSADSTPSIVTRLPIVGSPAEGDVPVWSMSASAFALRKLGTAPLRFEQGTAALLTSRVHHVVGAALYTRATLTVDTAAIGSVNLISVSRNGAVVATLGLTNGQTSASSTVDISAVDGDVITVTRLSLQGDGLVLELDGGV